MSEDIEDTEEPNAMEFRAPRYSRADNLAIDCEVLHPEFGWIPFTATGGDVEEMGRAVFNSILQSSAEIAPYEPPPLSQMVMGKLAELDAFRWEKEVGGAVFGSTVIRTDLNSQAKIAAAYTMAKLDPSYEISTWEVVPGMFMSLDNATIVAMGEAVRDHVQATFDRKAVVYAQLAALDTIEDVQAFDIAAAWTA